MVVKDVVGELVKLHCETQADGGFDDSDTVKAGVCPLDDLKGFDSLLIPQMIRQLARNIGQPLEKGTRVKNLYRFRGKNQTIKQIAEKFCETYVKEPVNA